MNFNLIIIEYLSKTVTEKEMNCTVIIFFFMKNRKMFSILIKYLFEDDYLKCSMFIPFNYVYL